MTGILDFIMQNYIWLLSGAILILLAIIGSYADKTNFGQGKTNEVDNLNQKKLQINNISIQDAVNNVNNVELKKEDEKDLDNLKAEPVQNETSQLKDQEVKIQTEPKNSSEEKYNKLTKSFDEFDKEFEQVLPKKELIDGDILYDIDNLSLDKTQKFNFKDIPDLDDVSLPKIKKFNKTDIDKDIWDI